MIGRLRTVVLDAADMDAEAQFWSALLDIPVVLRSDDWTTLQGRDVRLAVQLAPDHVPPHWPAEVANILWKAHRRKRIGDEDLRRIGQVASDLADAVVIGAELPPGRLAAEAARTGLTAYDASYLMLAQRLGAPLLADDGKLGRAAVVAGVELLRP